MPTVLVPCISGNFWVGVPENGWHGQHVRVGKLGEGVGGIPVGLTFGLGPAGVGGDGRLVIEISDTPVFGGEVERGAQHLADHGMAGRSLECIRHGSGGEETRAARITLSDRGCEQGQAGARVNRAQRGIIFLLGESRDCEMVITRMGHVMIVGTSGCQLGS